MFHVKLNIMSELTIIKLKFTLSLDDRIFVIVHQFVNHYDCNFFDKVSKKRFRCRIIRSYYPDIYKLIPLLKTIIDTNYNCDGYFINRELLDNFVEEL